MVSESDLIKQLKAPFFKGMTAFQLRYMADSKDKKLSNGARAELKRRKLKLR